MEQGSLMSTERYKTPFYAPQSNAAICVEPYSVADFLYSDNACFLGEQWLSAVHLAIATGRRRA